MANTDRAEEFYRNYFASYELKPSSSEEQNPGFEHNLVDCKCQLNCSFVFLPEARLQLRAWYQRLTPQGRVAFLKAHLREPSPSQVQYRLPTVAGCLEKVCAVHFLNTLQETKKRIREVVLDKRKPLEGNTEEGDEEIGEDVLPIKRYKKGTAGAAIIMERMARGLSYRTFNSKKVRPARKVKVPCTSVCKYKCYERFTLAEREQKLKDLLQLPLDKQRKFLSDLVCKLTAKRSRALSTGRRLTIYYCFREGRLLHRVCKTMFLNTYDITEKTFRGYMEEKGANTHEICGNSKIADILKMYHKRMVFDIDEGLDEEADKRILEEFLSNGCVNLEGTQQEEEYEEISIDYGTIKQELDETEQEILPDGPPASYNGITKAESVQHSNTIDPARHTDEMDPICNGVGEPTTVWIKTENMEVDETPRLDVKPPYVDYEMVSSDAEQLQLAIPLPQDNNLVHEDSNYEPEKTHKNDSVSAASKQRQRPPRMVILQCGTRCNMQCFTRVSDDLHRKLLADFRKMSPTTRRQFIGDHICVAPTVLHSSRSPRCPLHYHYFLPVESRLVKVCKLMFRSTYDLGFAYLREIIRDKGDNKHVVCGNPHFPAVLKKGVRYYFDYNEGYDQTAEEVCKCSLRCSTKVSEDAIERIRSGFDQKTTDEQYKFLFKYVQLPPGDKKLLFRARYFLPLNSPEQVQEVCWKMFLATFKVNQDYIRALLTERENTFNYAKAHIAAYRMDEDHHCEVAGGAGAVRKLSHCPNVARMYNEYLEGIAGQQQQQQQDQLQAIEYQQYFGEFSEYFSRTGLLLPAQCPDCGFFSSGEV